MNVVVVTKGEPPGGIFLHYGFPPLVSTYELLGLAARCVRSLGEIYMYSLSGEEWIRKNYYSLVLDKRTFFERKCTRQRLDLT